MSASSATAARLPWDAADPYPFYARRRRDGEVVWDDTARSWLVLGYHSAHQVLAGSGWSSDPSANPNLRVATDLVGAQVAGRSMLSVDGPDHRRLRNAARDVFTPSFITGLGQGIDALAAAVIDHRRPGEVFDFVAEIAVPLPIAVTAAWLGVDTDTADLLRQESPAISRMLGTFADPEAIAAGTAAFATLLTEFLPLAADRRTHPKEDLLSFIAADQDLPLDDVVITAILIAVAGHETTANLLGAAMVRLLTPAPDTTRIADNLDACDPSLVTELLRLDGPVQAVARTATTDQRIADTHIAAGQPVLVCLAAANRDPAVFDDPDQFRLGRPGPAPLAFGHGAHHCLGAALARLQTTVALQRILARNPILAGPPIWRDTPAIRGPQYVPIIFGVR